MNLESCITSQFELVNDCVLFVLVKVAFVALLSGAIWVDSSSPIFIFGAVNCCEVMNFVLNQFDLFIGCVPIERLVAFLLVRKKLQCLYRQLY